MTAEQFIANIRDWNPNPETRRLLSEALTSGRVPESSLEPLTASLIETASAAFHYIETVHGLTGRKDLDKKDFISHLARMVEGLHGLEKGSANIQKAFQRYQAATQDGLRKDRFDTTYYDAIQGFDVKGALRPVLQDVEILLKSFSLVSAELSGVKCLELYEECVRFHLYLQYLMKKSPLSPEECWSILFDLSGLFKGEGGRDVEDLKEELEDFKLELEEIRKNRNN